LNFPVNDVIPVLRPDEFLRGHQAVLAAFNGHTRRLHVRDMVVSHARTLGHTGVRSFLDGIAAVNGLHPDALISAHTCYPVLHLVGERMWVGNPDHADLRAIETAVIRAPEHGWRFCPACVKADLSELRYSYWHRRHQVPGKWMCPTHECVLLCVDDFENVGLLPEELLEEGRAVRDARELESLSQLPCVARAVDILDQLMIQNVALDAGRCRSLFRARVQARGEDPSARRWFAAFSAEMDRSFSLAGLSSLMNSNTKLQAGQPRWFAVGAFAPGTALSHTTVAIVASLLFRTAAAACTALRNSGAGTGHTAPADLCAAA
jgi:hypothetical protein